MAGASSPDGQAKRKRDASGEPAKIRRRSRSQLKVRRALISVYDKDGVVDLARGLAELGIEILSTGGTARMLIDNAIPVVRIADYTGFPEMLDGRVKTLHPKIHGGIMAVRGNKTHMKQIDDADIPPIDLVIVNLYPFEKTAAMEGIGFDEIVEMIDIGGPALVRAAAKNFRHVGVVVDPSHYVQLLGTLRDEGTLPEEQRFNLAREAFRHVAAYDTAVYSYLSMLETDGTLKEQSRESLFPPRLTLELLKAADLRYGENPHQGAAFYRDPVGNTSTVSKARKLQGKDLSFNNIIDLDAAFRLACEFEQPVCAAIKHTNPCGVGTGRDAAEAFRRAKEADPVSIFGGILGFNVEVDAECAGEIAEMFIEAVIAPSFHVDALERLRRRKNLRLLVTGGTGGRMRRSLDLRRVAGGLLAQEWDNASSDPSEGRIVTSRAPTGPEMEALRFAWRVVRHVRSNAIVYANPERSVGIGAGQMSRVDAVKFGALKGGDAIKGSVLASDAFFPFRDSIDDAAGYGVTAIVQPGGSVRDDESIAAADEHGLAMVFTGVRHFRH